MPSGPVKKQLAADVGAWLTDGVISPEQAAKLRARYDGAGFGLASAVRW
jgi:hypothetical protein